MRDSRSMVLVLAFVALMVAGSVKAGPKWDLSEDSYMKLSFLGQPHFAYNKDAADQEDFYLRRARFILDGQIQDGVKFFVETDNDNAGKNGGAAVSTDVQDIFVDIRLAKTDNTEHWMEAGLILLPFSFENKSSAASLLGVDYNSEAVKLVNTFVWRDYGAEFHGNLGSKFSYKVGAFDGYDAAGSSKNADASLRYTGHLAYNLIGNVESGWFYGQNRLSDENYLSLGVGADTQDKATLTIVNADPVAGTPEVRTVKDSDAWVIDMQSGYKIGKVGVTVNAAYYDWDSSVFKGNTEFLEAGVMVGKVMAVGKCSVQNPDAGSDTTDYTAGLHYFPKKHNLRGGLEYRWGDSSDSVLLGMQFLL